MMRIIRNYAFKSNMPRSRRLAAAVFLACLVVAAASAQFVANDLSDPVYRYIDVWIAKGLVDTPFMLRPYSPEVIRAMLRQVAERGDDWDKASASMLLGGIADSYIGLGLSHESQAKLSNESGSSEYYGGTGPFIQVDAKLSGTIWVSGNMAIDFADQKNTSGPVDTMPAGEYPTKDLVSDSGNIPLKGINGKELTPRLSLDSELFVGGEDLWFSTGYSRSSFGPFFDNGVVLGSHAPAAPNWTLNYRWNKWRYSMILMDLTKSAETSPVNTTDPRSAFQPVSASADKYLIFHSFSYAVTPVVDISIFETVVWASNFEPLYLTPWANYFIFQSLSGFADNSIAGLYGTWRLPGNVSTKAQIYLDDIGFNDLVRLNFDTKLLAAGEIGLDWAPSGASMKLLSANYTAVLPYFGVHFYTGQDENDYTQKGQPIGADLLPNSDRLELSARFLPSPSVEVTPLIRLIRHGNASEGIPGAGDGGLYDSGWVDGVATYQTNGIAYSASPRYLRFLTQSVLEYIGQAQIGASVRTKLAGLDLKLSGSYTFQYTANKLPYSTGGEPQLGVNEIANFLSLGVSVLF